MHLELRFDEDLARLVYAGADMLVMPSHTEPCELVQMMALNMGRSRPIGAAAGHTDRYGTVDTGQSWMERAPMVGMGAWSSASITFVASGSPQSDLCVVAVRQAPSGRRV